MRVFVIHRFADRRRARRKLKEIANSLSLELRATFLDSSGGIRWKQRAENAINKAEAVIIFNADACKESENAIWEIEKSKQAKKEVIELQDGQDNTTAISRLHALYHLAEDFERCFSIETKNVLELYKLMVESSEQLIRRRQRTNAFFITVIGSLLAIAGVVARTGAITVESVGILYGFSIVGLLLCNSWRNLIDNYGKLNRAKFDVILRLEKALDAQIYSAEWIALGKGLRPSKYRSFTSTEKNVPLFFALLILALTLLAVTWQIWS